MTPTPYRARQAREAAGYSASIAARRLGITRATLLRMEREGFPEWRARRAAALYRCPCDERFLGWDRDPQPEGGRLPRVAVRSGGRRLTGPHRRGNSAAET